MSKPSRHIEQLGAATLVERIRRDEQVGRIVRSISGGAHRVDITGLQGSSPAFVIEALRESLSRTIVVCCPDEETARDVCEDLGTISAARVELFPAKDIFPQRFELRENLAVRGKRNACLDRILRDDIDIVVTSLLGFLEKTFPAPVLRDNTIELVRGDELDLDGLRGDLVRVGYDATHTVEEPGQFAVRGGIIDVFDPSWDYPFRLELLDDEITSIRAFDIDSQRSFESLENVRILPAASVIVNEESLDDLEVNLRKNGFAEQTLRRIRREISDHRFSFLLRRYAPAMGIDGSVLDFFTKPPLLFFWNETGLAHALDGLRNEIEHVGALADSDEPVLDLIEYVHAPEYYTAYLFPAVHLWGLARPAGSAPRRAGLDSREGETGKGGEELPRPPDEVIEFRTQGHPSVLGKLDPLVQTLRRLRKRGVDVHIFSESPAQRERLADMLGEDEQHVHLPVGWMTSGFVWESNALAILTDHEIFQRRLPRPSRRPPARRRQYHRPDHLQIGDFVVHVDYGIGRYLGLEKVVAEGNEAECLNLRYQGTDRIYVPLEQMHLVEKYVGKEGVVPSIDRLGSSKWQRTKEKTKKALEDIARDLLHIYAEREIADGVAFGADTQWQKELEASFPFEETPHQLKATEELKQDMESPRPMDRLVCGDVGFGKTEVAVRAAFKAVNHGKQVAILVPTTILALQHFQTFRERMEAFPVKVEMLSRFRSPADQRKIVRELKTGTVDVVIGTHRLLSKDVGFHDIGLLIIDEEHRFGVRSKEKIKRLARSVDVISMTATPIPRTLYMSISGLRRISVIDTPPRNRHPIKTEVLPFDEGTIEQVIRTEIKRGGQVFFVHNRVASIHSMQAFLERLLPDVTFGVAHGQMAEKELERVVLRFLDRQFDVLISTTIIESGLDFPNVNTIIINRADRYGLAELYQLRGRVGRREQQAFAYLLVPRNFSITETASKRLQAIEEFEELGSGYRLAMRDLEIRGAGNVLGVEQHGQIVAVGFDLYCKMLKEAVEKLKGTAKEELPQCRIETRLPSFLPDDYVEDQNERMAIYKRIARFDDPTQADELATELADRFGELPREAVNLIDLARMKLQAMRLGLALIQFQGGRVAADFLPEKSFHPRLCAQLVETFQGRVLFKSGETFGLTLALEKGASPLAEAKKLLQSAFFYDKTYNPANREHPT
ncbi:MAG: transcription-repair coupling factor [Candidatus Latescibacterota bacterium]|nr:MAG: transcription-repair coupling factor [Candidatus Latescibacterota bacterium]